MKNRILRTLLLATLGLVVGGLIALISIYMEQPNGVVKVVEDKAAGDTLNIAGIGGAWTLTDQDGKVRSNTDFPNKFQLIYFGFTYCPTICPTELQKMAQAYVSLPPAIQDKIQMLFITVDPERDTVKLMKNYVGLFHPNLIGLTGTVDEIEEVKKTFKVYAAKVPQGDDYTVDHSSFIYLMRSDGTLAKIFKGKDSAEDMTAYLQTL
jgi:protein SCO1